MASEKHKFSRKHAVIFGVIFLAAMGGLGYLGMQQHSDVYTLEQDPNAPPPSLTMGQEVLLGLQIKPLLEEKFKGLSTNADQLALINRVGGNIVTRAVETQNNYTFSFNLLVEPDVIDAFALPGGQVYITSGMLNRLLTEGQVASVLAHQIAHIVQHHTVTQLLASNVPPEQRAAQFLALRYTAAQEAEADAMTVKLLGQTGYDPAAFLGVLKILATAYYASAQVEFFTTHPNSKTRIEDINAAMAKNYPDGVPDNYSK